MAYEWQTVTSTGRALSKGRVTRASENVRRRHKGMDRPLSFNMQCHPQALDKTPKHPGCETRVHWAGKVAGLMKQPAIWFFNGHGLDPEVGRNKYALYVLSRIVGYSNDPNYALAWYRAAATKGLQSEMRQLY